MASSIIHIAVANEINKVIKKDKSKLFIGTIAPDISKLIGETKTKSHFLEENDKQGIPRLDWFLYRYQDKLNDDFVLGYYIHLFTDYLWFKYFLGEIRDDKTITKLDGTIVKVSDYMLIKYIYNDYTNLNTYLLDKYGLDCKIFYSSLPKFDNIITEIPMNEIQKIVDFTGIIIENSKVGKDLIFNKEQVDKFIELSVKLILPDLKEKGVY